MIHNHVSKDPMPASLPAEKSVPRRSLPAAPPVPTFTCCFTSGVACSYVHEQGKGPGEGFTINVPLPPGSGKGAYEVG